MTAQGFPGLGVISVTMGHHAGPSGYHRLAEYLGGDTYSGDDPDIVARAIAALAKPLIRRSGSLWYHRADFIAELGVLRARARSRELTFHFLYGENSYRYAGWFDHRRKGHRLVATFHTPGWRTRQVVSGEAHLKRLDAIITMSRSQNEYFADYVGEERVFFVPHGVDVDYFRPAAREAEREAYRFVTVGHHLRDFEALAEVARAMAVSHAHVEFVVVAWPDRVGALTGLPNVVCTTGLTDAGLRALYQDADALLLPLKDATANNALLEAMACGLPVISTDIQGVRDYVSPDAAVLHAPGDTDALIELARSAADGGLPVARMRAAGRARAEALAWPRVAQRVREVYARIRL